MNNSFTKEFSISSFDLNPKGQARLTTMANFFQEMAYHHANQLGFGYDDMKEKQTFWVLSRMRIKIDQYPVWDDKVRVETWHRGMERIFGLRDFRVENTSGDLLGVASTAWLILDSQTRRPIRIIDEVLQNSRREDAVFNEGLDKVVLPEKMMLFRRHKVLFSDLDIVGHVNNVKYMEWCIDAAITKDQTDREIHELEINFTHEALFGDEIEITGVLNSNTDSFFLARRGGDDKEIFRARLAWK